MISELDCEWVRALPSLKQRQISPRNGRVNVFLLLSKSLVDLLVAQYKLIIIRLPEYVPPMIHIAPFLALSFFDLVDESLDYLVGSFDVVGLGLLLPTSDGPLVVCRFCLI